jgi:hypothetical protein
LKVLSLTSTGPGICNFTCAIKVCEIFHKPMKRQEKPPVPPEGLTGVQVNFERLADK